MAAKNGKNNGKQESLAAAVTEVSERVTLLIREEIELAKAEVTTKVSSLSKGIVAGAIGAVLALLLIPFLLLTIAWALNDAFGSLWAGFLIVTGLLLAGMGAAFFIAWRKIKAAGNPAPTMAIGEAKKIRETVSRSGNGSAPAVAKPASVKDVVATTPVPVAAPVPAAAPAEPETAVAAPAADAEAIAPETVVAAPAADAEAVAPETEGGAEAEPTAPEDAGKADSPTPEDAG